MEFAKNSLTGGSGSATPGGSNTQVQFNDAGAFNGSSDFTFNKSTSTLSAGGSIISAGSLFAGTSGGIVFNARTQLRSSADGILELQNNAGSGFTRLNFGGTTSSFPALGRSSAILSCKLADDSNYAKFIASSVLDATYSITSSATLTPNSDICGRYTVTALAEAATFGAPTGTPTDGQKLIIRIKDNGTARALTWNAAYRAGADISLPSTTVISKTMYLGFQYNSADSKWDLVGSLGGF